VSFIATGSGLERFMMCRASAVLHRSFDVGGSDASSRGVAVHEFLERIASGMSREESLEMVDERYRKRCESIGLEELHDVLGMSPEVSFAYDPATDSARMLGSGLGREYLAAGVGPHEIPLTVDLCGIDLERRIGAVVDWKDTWGRVTRADRNWQMRGGALALSRAFDLDEVGVQLIYLRDGVPAHRDRATYTAADLAMFAAEARVRHGLALADRDTYRSEGVEPESARGAWCHYCPSYHACSAQTALIRAALNPDEFDDVRRTSPIPPEAVADAWRRLRDIKRPLKMLESSLYAAAKERPVLLEIMPDGTEVWLGTTEVVGNTKLDADVARTVVREMLGDEAADEIATFSVSQGRIETAIKARVARGYGASKMRAVLAEIGKRNGVHKPTKHEVDVYKIAPRALKAV
jgi:hypothetical protein